MRCKPICGINFMRILYHMTSMHASIEVAINSVAEHQDMTKIVCSRREDFTNHYAKMLVIFSHLQNVKCKVSRTLGNT